MLHEAAVDAFRIGRQADADAAGTLTPWGLVLEEASRGITAPGVDVMLYVGGGGAAAAAALPAPWVYPHTNRPHACMRE